MPLFETQVSLACPPESLFDYLIRPANVMTLNPPDIDLTLLEAPEVVGEGSRILLQIEAFGYKQQLVHEILNFQRPEGFLLREVEGVLKKFEHVHRFENGPDGTTVFIEQIEYEPPGGMVGFLLTESKIRESMEKNFGFRHDELIKHFGPA